MGDSRKQKYCPKKAHVQGLSPTAHSNLLQSCHRHFDWPRYCLRRLFAVPYVETSNTFFLYSRKSIMDVGGGAAAGAQEEGLVPGRFALPGIIAVKSLRRLVR